MEKNQGANGARGHDLKERRRKVREEINLQGVIAPPKGHFVKERYAPTAGPDNHLSCLLRSSSEPVQRLNVNAEPPCLLVSTFVLRNLVYSRGICIVLNFTTYRYSRDLPISYSIGTLISLSYTVDFLLQKPPTTNPFQEPASRAFSPTTVVTTAGGADAPRFDGASLTDFLDVLSRHGERAGLSLDELTPIIVSYCTPEVQRVVRYLPELQRDARSWDDAVSELHSLYGSDDGAATYTIADLHEFCSGTCRGSPFRSLSDAEAYLRRYTQISGYLRELGFLTAAEVQVYLVAGLPFETQKDVEGWLPDVNRGTDSPPTKRQVVHILRDLLRRDSYEASVAARLSPSRSSSSPSSDAPNPSVAQSRLESKPQRRSHRCFVCGRTGSHRLSPKFCPRTWELVEHGLARF
ncbi:hypothetical protein K438DRAFT_1775435 [Mycena galopus ATCC 62051]|nr:hypothetical protein K438DRAFT_1775435 [Mycena galopus ATCC 62051]